MRLDCKKISIFCSLFGLLCSFPLSAQNPPNQEAPLDPHFAATVDDPAGFAMRHFAQQRHTIDELFQHPERTTDGQVISLDGSYLEILGAHHPHLIPLDRPLMNLIGYCTRADARQRLREQGFTSAMFERITSAGEPALEDHLRRALRETAASVPSPEAAEAEIRAYLDRYEQAEWSSRRDWAARFLKRFDETELRILVRVLRAEFLTRAAENYQRIPATTNLVAATRARWRQKLAQRDWRGSASAVPVNPPPLLTARNGQHLFWIAPHLLHLVQDGRTITFKDSGLYSPKQAEQVEQAFRFKILDLRRNETIPCTRVADTPSPADPYRFLQDTAAIFVGVVEKTTQGFVKINQPATLLTVRVQSWLREPTRGARKRYYLINPNARIAVDDLVFCREDARVPDNPTAGQRLLIMAQSRPRDQGATILEVSPHRLLWENRPPSHWPFEQNPPDQSFDELVDYIRERAERTPFTTHSR
jgi:hypothetical protein